MNEQFNAAMFPYAVMVIGGLLSIVGVLGLIVLNGIKGYLRDLKAWAQNEFVAIREEFAWTKGEIQNVHGRVTDVSNRVSTLEGRMRAHRTPEDT